MTSHNSPTEALLVIASHPPGGPGSLLPFGTAQNNVSVVLIQDAVAATDIPAPSVHVLEQDLQMRGGTSPYPRITYSELVRMMFDATRVMVL